QDTSAGGGAREIVPSRERRPPHRRLARAPRPRRPAPFPYTPLFRSWPGGTPAMLRFSISATAEPMLSTLPSRWTLGAVTAYVPTGAQHTCDLQPPRHLVCRHLLVPNDIRLEIVHPAQHRPGVAVATV